MTDQEVSERGLEAPLRPLRYLRPLNLPKGNSFMFQRVFSDTESSNIDQISIMNSGDVLITYKSNLSKLYQYKTDIPVEIVSQVQAMSFPTDSIGKKINEWRKNDVLSEVIVKSVGVNTTVTL